MSMTNHDHVLERASELVERVTEARFSGTTYAKLARAHGYADGYMRALIDAGLASQGDLLKLVASARRKVMKEDNAA